MADVKANQYFEVELKDRTAKTVAQSVSIYSGVALSDILNNSRQAHLVRLRSIIFLTLKRIGWSYPRIANEFGRDHSTIQHACKVVASRLSIGDKMLIAELAGGPAAVGVNCKNEKLGTKVSFMVDRAAAFYIDRRPSWLLRYYRFVVIAKILSDSGLELEEIAKSTETEIKDVEHAIAVAEAGGNEIIGHMLTFSKSFLRVAD